MGSVQTFFDNLDFMAFIKEFFSEIFKGKDFMGALSGATSSQGSSALSSTMPKPAVPGSK